MKTNKKVEQIKKEIRTGYMEFTKSNRRTTEQAIALGHLFNNLKKEVKQNKQFWQQYAEKTFPNIHRKTRELFMRIAKQVGQNYPTALHLLPRTSLDSLGKLCGTDDIGTHLEKQGIDLEFRSCSKSVTNFQKEVAQLLDKSADEQKPSLRSVPAKLFYQWLGKLEKQIKSSQIHLNKKRLNILKKINTRLSRIIAYHTEE